MKNAEVATEPARADATKPDLHRIVAAVRHDLAKRDFPEELVSVACSSVEQAAAGVVSGAEARERKRIIRWLRTVADVYAARFRAAKGEETVYWADQLEAFSHAADAISRRRHASPH